MHRTKITLLTLLALLLIAGTAAAQRHMMGGPGMMGGQGYGQGYGQQQYGQQQYGQGYGYQMTEEQWNKMYDLRQKHMEEIAPLQQKLWSKDAELASLLHQENPDEKKVDKLIDDIGDLRTQIYKKQLQFRREAQKDLGMPMGPGMMGPGMMGGGHMRGVPGMMGGGAWGNCPYTQSY